MSDFSQFSQPPLVPSSESSDEAASTTTVVDVELPVFPSPGQTSSEGEPSATRTLIHEKMRYEQTVDTLPTDAPSQSRIRHALLHGMRYTAAEVADQFDVSSPTLSMILADFKRAGFQVASEKLDDGTKRSWLVNPQGHKPEAFQSRAVQKAQGTAPVAKKTSTPLKRSGGATPLSGFRAGLTRDIALQLAEAFPDAVVLEHTKPITQVIFKLRKDHGWRIEGGWAGSIGSFKLLKKPSTGRVGRPPGKATARKSTPPTTPAPEPIPEVVIETPTLEVGHIVEVVIEAFYPDGKIPIALLDELWEWRAHTEQFLTRLQSYQQIRHVVGGRTTK